MNYLSFLGFDKDYESKNIYLYMAECGENMTKSYHASFLTFWLYYETNPTWLLGSQIFGFLNFMSYVDIKTYAKFNGTKLFRRRRKWVLHLFRRMVDDTI